MTRSPSTPSRAVSVTLEPTSPGSLSTVRTSSSATFSCLPPQRTIAYTRELSLSFALPSVPRNSGVTTAGCLERAHGRPHMRAYSRRSRLPDVGAGTNPGRSALWPLDARLPRLMLTPARPVQFIRFSVVDPGLAVDQGDHDAPDQPPGPFSPRSFPSSRDEDAVARLVSSVLQMLNSAVLGSGRIGGAG